MSASRIVDILLRSSLSFMHLSQIECMLSGKWEYWGLSLLMTTFTIIWYGFKPSHKAFSPNSSMSSAPNAYTSTLSSTISALSCSGAWNPGVPDSIVLVPSWPEEITFASPKSARNTWLSLCTCMRNSNTTSMWQLWEQEFPFSDLMWT